MKRTTYFAEITDQKAEKYLSERGKLESMLACLLALCQLRKFLREFSENCFAVFSGTNNGLKNGLPCKFSAKKFFGYF